jgi:hypothetical protein
VMAHLVETGKISQADIEEAQRLLDTHLAKNVASRDKPR